MMHQDGDILSKLRTYEAYVETRKSYKFGYVDRVTWQEWQIRYYGCYKSSKTGEIKTTPDEQDTLTV